MRPFSNATRAFALAGLLAVLCGCSGYYLDRRETIALSGGNATASDAVTHMVDPWPRESANRDIAFNGARIEGAMVRYRTNRVIAPQRTGTSAAYQDTQGAAGPINAMPGGVSMTQPVAPAK